MAVVVGRGWTALMGLSTRTEADSGGRRHVVLLIQATTTSVP
jgi:hypothetical protein